MLVREEEELLAPLEGPVEDAPGVGRRADDAAVAAAEGFQGGGGVHVGDGDDVADAELGQRVPGGLDVVALGHVGHRAAGLEVRQDHLLVRLGEDVGALGHEVDAAEEDEFGIAAAGGLLRELEGVAPEVGELDDLVPLIVVSEDHQILAELPPQRPDLRVPLGAGHLEVFAGNPLLAGRGHAVAAQQPVGADGLLRHAVGRFQLRLRQPRCSGVIRACGRRRGHRQVKRHDRVRCLLARTAIRVTG